MKFNEILNHTSAKSFLISSINLSRQPQSFLISGKKGVGKTTIAITIARLFNCLSEDKLNCDSCPNCIRILSYNHPDIQFIEKLPGRLFINIDQIRDIQYNAGVTPIMGLKKAFIIKEAENLNPSASNCLLKILEEPPKTSIIILTSTNPNLLLPTIKSRCVEIQLKPINEDEIKKWLREKHNLSEENAKIVSALSDGSPGIAKQMIDENFIDARNKILENLIQFEQEEQIALFKHAYNISQYSENLKESFNFILLWFRDILIYQISNNENLIINKDKIESIRTTSKNYDTFSLLQIIDFIQYILYYSYKRLNHQLALEVLLNKIYKLRTSV